MYAVYVISEDNIYFQSLLSLLTLPLPDTGNIGLNAIRTLHELTSCLEARIYYHQDPALYTPKQGTI